MCKNELVHIKPTLNASVAPTRLKTGGPHAAIS